MELSHILDNEDYFDMDVKSRHYKSVQQSKPHRHGNHVRDPPPKPPPAVPSSQRKVSSDYENADNLGNQLACEQDQIANSHLIKSGKLIREIKGIPDQEILTLTPAKDPDYENSEVLDEILENQAEDTCIYQNRRGLENPIYQSSDYRGSDAGSGLVVPPELERGSGRVYGTSESNPGDDVLELRRPKPAVSDPPDYENSEIIDEVLFSDNISTQNQCNTSDSDVSQSDHPLRESPAECATGVIHGVTSEQLNFPMRRCSTLHRESEINIETIDSNTLDGTVLNCPGGQVAGGMSIQLNERVKSSVTPFTIKPSYRGHPGPGRGNSELSKLGTFERTLLQGVGPATLPMPNPLQIPWYHEGITRHIAEALLMGKAIRDGVYLLRDSNQGANSLTLSVRCQRSVKHYRILWDGKQYGFGLGKFPDLESLLEHFENQPIISGESGILVQLLYPYPRSVAEPAIYTDPVEGEASDAGSAGEKQLVSKKWTRKDKPPVKIPPSLPELSVNSKEGFLTKQGQKVKNWKRRWFVLFRNELKYYLSQESKEAIKSIDLRDVSAVERDESQGKKHCFRMVTSYRTFFMYGISDVEANEWVQILDWKLGQRSRSNSRV